MAEASRRERAQKSPASPRSRQIAILVAGTTLGSAMLGALIWAHPDLNPADAAPIGIGAALGCALAATVLKLRQRMRNRKGRGRAALTVRPVERAAGDAMQPVDEPIHQPRPPLTTSAREIANALGIANVSRVFLVGSPHACADGAIALSRDIARRGSSTILVDLSQNALAMRRMGVFEAVEDVAIMAASAKTFAHSIQRDRSSAAHCIATDLRALPSEPITTIQATATVLEALAQAYSRSVVVAGSLTFDHVQGLADGRTAVVLVVENEREAAEMAYRFADGDASDLLFMMPDRAEHRAAA